MSETPDTFVLWLVPKAWEEEGRILPQYGPIPLDVWLGVIRTEGLHLRRIPNSLVAGGPCDRGHVVAVDGDMDTNLFALPLEALTSIKDLLSPSDYASLLQQSGGQSVW